MQCLLTSSKTSTESAHVMCSLECNCTISPGKLGTSFLWMFNLLKKLLFLRPSFALLPPVQEICLSRLGRAEGTNGCVLFFHIFSPDAPGPKFFRRVFGFSSQILGILRDPGEQGSLTHPLTHSLTHSRAVNPLTERLGGRKDQRH